MTGSIIRRRFVIIAVFILAFLIAIVTVVQRGSAAPESTRVVPDDVKSALAEGSAIQLKEASGTTVEVTEQEAIARASRLPGVADQQPEVYLVYFTDDNLGEVASEQDGQEVERFYVERLAWLIVFRETVQPIFGPYRSGEEPIATEYVVDLAAFVDASTGEFLEAVTL